MTTAVLNEKPVRIWEHSLTPGLVNTLEKIADRVRATTINRVNIGDLGLSNSEYNNWQKLRYFGLIAKYREQGVHVRGDWVITSWGFLFLLGRKKIPVYVKTRLNAVLERYGDLTSYGDIKRRTRSEEYWQEFFQSWVEGPDVQTNLFAKAAS